jgi:hypothetical protein
MYDRIVNYLLILAGALAVCGFLFWVVNIAYVLAVGRPIIPSPHAITAPVAVPVPRTPPSI